MTAGEILNDCAKLSPQEQEFIKKELIKMLSNDGDDDWLIDAQRSVIRAQRNALFHALSDGPNGVFDFESIAKAVASRCCRILVPGLHLSRCAIVTPLRDTPSFWFFLSSIGFPSDLIEAKDYYVRGQGLTGRTLECVNSRHFIHSPDVESDETWSRRGRQLHRKPNEVGLLSFLGIPIFSRRFAQYPLPYGAIVCCRFGDSPGKTNDFKPKEIRHLQNIASLLGYAFEVLQWRRMHNIRRETISALQALWRSEATDTLSRALAIIANAHPIKRLLLATVSETSEHVVGRAVAGFRKDLIQETVRPIFSTNRDLPPFPGEDVLAFIVRRQLKKPEIVDLNSSEQLALLVNRQTANRHGVKGQLIIVPLLGRKNETFGCLLGEFPKDHPNMNVDDLAAFTRFGSEVAMLTCEEQQTKKAQRKEFYAAEFLHLFGQHENQRLTDGKSLRSLISLFCRAFDFEFGMLLVHDADARLLHAKAAFGLSQQKLRELTFSSDEKGTPHTESGLVRAIRENRHIFVRHNLGPQLPTSDRQRMGIPPDASVLIVPLSSGSENIGALLVGGRNSENPLLGSESELKLYTGLATEFLRFILLTETLKQAEASQQAYEICLRQIARIAAYAPPSSPAEVIVNHAEPIGLLLDEAAKVLGAEKCALFMPDEAIVLTQDSSPRSFAMSEHIRDQFRLRFGIGYPWNWVSEQSVAYAAQGKGLTSSVLRTLEPQHTADVEEEKLWSRQPPPLLPTERLEDWKIRTWVGVPVLYRDQEKSHLYGVLTFTRRRSSKQDGKYFRDVEVLWAERLGWLVAMGLHSQQEIRREYLSVKTSLRRFLHSVRIPIDLVQHTRVEEILRGCKEPPALGKIRQMCEFIQLDLDFVSAGFVAFSDFAGRIEVDPSMFSEISIADVLKVVTHVTNISREVTVEPPVFNPQDFRCRLPRERLIYLIHALISNGVKAAEQGTNVPKWVKTLMNANDNFLVIIVEDNGCGMSPETEKRMFEEGFSNFEKRSSGLGMTIAQGLVKGLGGSIECKTRLGRGTKITIRIPI